MKELNFEEMREKGLDFVNIFIINLENKFTNELASTAKGSIGMLCRLGLITSVEFESLITKIDNLIEKNKSNAKQ